MADTDFEKAVTWAENPEEPTPHRVPPGRVSSPLPGAELAGSGTRSPPNALGRATVARTCPPSAPRTRTLRTMLFSTRGVTARFWARNNPGSIGADQRVVGVKRKQGGFSLGSPSRYKPLLVLCRRWLGGPAGFTPAPVTRGDTAVAAHARSLARFGTVGLG